MLTLCLFILVFSQNPAPASTTVDAALKAYRIAIETGDVEAFAKLSAGPLGEKLRQVAPALKKAQVASDAFSKSLGDKPALGLANPLAGDYQPLKDYQIEIIEMTPGKDEHLVRVRFGTVGRLKEETLSIKKEGEQFRISIPSAFLPSAKLMTPERIAQQVEALNKLASLLNQLAMQVTKGELTTKEAIVLKLAQGVREAKLGEGK